MSRDCRNRGEGSSPSIQWEEAKDAAKPPTVRVSRPNKVSFSPESLQGQVWGTFTQSRSSLCSIRPPSPTAEVWLGTPRAQRTTLQHQRVHVLILLFCMFVTARVCAQSLIRSLSTSECLLCTRFHVVFVPPGPPCLPVLGIHSFHESLGVCHSACDRIQVPDGLISTVLGTGEAVAL